jgi:hypothetical protein
MNESSDAKTRRRWINLGEIIAVAALIVSAIGVWIAWKSTSNDRPTKVVEQRLPIPLTLRGTVERDGRALVIAPVEQSHALESLTLKMAGASPIELGSDGMLDSSDVESALKGRDADDKGSHNISVRIAARYVEMGKDRISSGNYVLRYRWEGGGLLGGRSLRIAGLSR